ncbi:hypothetical protein FRB99_008740 [Tulasnella sp. 403]|nr:hypothetical protein FRB99_008740 [Tulasnella sp. 403]
MLVSTFATLALLASSIFAAPVAQPPVTGDSLMSAVTQWLDTMPANTISKRDVSQGLTPEQLEALDNLPDEKQEELLESLLAAVNEKAQSAGVPHQKRQSGKYKDGKYLTAEQKKKLDAWGAALRNAASQKQKREFTPGRSSSSGISKRWVSQLFTALTIATTVAPIMKSVLPDSVSNSVNSIPVVGFLAQALGFRRRSLEPVGSATARFNELLRQHLASVNKRSPDFMLD